MAWLFVVAIPGVAGAETLVVAGRPLELAPPFGYCRLSPELPAEAALIERLSARDEARLQVVLSFADCAELDQWRRGLRPGLDRTGRIGALLAGGEAMVVNAPAPFIEDMKKGYPPHVAAEIAAGLEYEALLAEGSGYLVHARAEHGGAGLHLGVAGVTVIGSIALEVGLSQPGTGDVAEDGRRIAESGAIVAASIDEIQVVNDIFDEVEPVSTGTQSGNLNLMTAVAGGLGLFGILAIRSLWLLLRAPRRQV